MTEICWFHMIRLTLVVLNDKKLHFFVMNFIKNCSKSQFHENTDENLTYVSLCVIWQHYPRNMYSHLHKIGLTGATELGTVTCHFAPNQCRLQLTISWWILLRRNNIFGKKFKVELKCICAEFQIFSTLCKHDITILIIISHGNGSLTSYAIIHYDSFTYHYSLQIIFWNYCLY